MRAGPRTTGPDAVSEGTPIDDPSGTSRDASPRARRSSARTERRSDRRRRLIRLAAVALVFLLGLVIGMTIEDRPRPGGEHTIVNTLRVSTLAPVETVTVTVQSP